MTCPIRLRTVLIAAALLPLGAPARAQVGIGPGGHGGPPPSSASDEPKKQAPPPAIPGAQASPDSVVPAAKGAKDLDPNAALFDAIDRGDLTAARDALNRGADLNARNVLGQRPLDMSIDLSRNPITFLLLSMRSQDGDPNAGASTRTSDDATPAPGAAKPTRRHGHARAPIEVATAAKPASSADVPQPSAGFLGFGSR